MRCLGKVRSRVNCIGLVNSLVFCSAICSVVLLFYTSRLDTGRQIVGNERLAESHPVPEHQRKLKQHLQTTKSLKVVVQELAQETVALKEELSYLQKALYESQLEKKSNGSSRSGTGCSHNVELPKCQVIHLAIVCAGYNETRRVVTLIKSLLFFRRHPLHFHFISDTKAQGVLKTLFKTWKLQQVLISFYDADSLKAFVDWIPNRHYSGVYGLMKLTLTKSLPESLHRVIVLDTDVFFLTDVAELWEKFYNFNGQKAIGLVENQSKWYLGKLWKHYQPWPALGRGFNTGVMLLDLRKLRSLGWPTLWRMTAEKQLMNLLSTTLADQDVINAAIKDNPYLVYRLPCEWNIQFSDNTQSELCYNTARDLKVVHWNSPKKAGVKHKQAEYFRDMYLTFLRYDGSLLRRKLFLCDLGRGDQAEKAQEAPDSPTEDEDCAEFAHEQNLSRRVHLYFLDFKYQAVENDVTLLVHMSMDRLQILEALMDHWKGPISLSLYATDAEAQTFLEFAQKSPAFLQRKEQNIGVHLVYKNGDLYPVNYLRNVALEQVQTPYVFLSDIDFLPVPGLYEYLRNFAAGNSLDKKALVVPAFESFQYKLDFPRTKLDLLSLLAQGRIKPFRSDVWPQGHGPTLFDKWKSSISTYKITWEPDFEPYVMVQRGVPSYDMRFLGFGWNKVSHILELHAQGYEFIVSPDVFIVHMPHSPSFDITRFRSSRQYRRCLLRLKEEFKRSLAKKYSVQLS